MARMPKNIRYRGVPASISKQLADHCFDFGDETYWVMEDLEAAAKRIFNARLTADPVDWEGRLNDARGHLQTVQNGLKNLRSRLRRIEKLAPKLVRVNGPR